MQTFRGKIGRRLTAIVVLCFSITIIIVATLSVEKSRSLAVTLLKDRCVTATNILSRELGDSVDLTADHTSLLDSLKESTGCELTIFNGNIRTSTTIIKDGKRAVGTTLTGDIEKTVLTDKAAFTGTAEILGTTHICSYVPIIQNGRSVGLIFAGVSQADATVIINSVVTAIIGVSFLLLVISCVIIYLFVTFIVTRPLKKLTNLANEMSNGNLGISSGAELKTDIHSNDEIGLLSYTFETTFTRLQHYIKEISHFLGMLSNKDLQAVTTLEYVGDFASIKDSLENISYSLNNTMNQIHIASNEVSSGSNQVSQAAQILSSGATQQASAIDELSSSLNNISEHVNQNSLTARNTQEKAITIDKFIQDTNVLMQKMVEAMEQISLTSNKIADIDKTIGDIAFQTNILALNASVEASRAGDAGKGFAVVANEVRNLANKSTDASKITDSLIEQALVAVNEGTHIVSTIMQSTTHAADSIDEIVDLITNISDATSEQATSIGQFSAAIKEISMVVQTNSATAEQSAAASEELSSHAESLLEMVDSFNLNKY